MTPAFFLIAIMGCGEGDAPCQQVRLLDTHYTSRSACTEAAEAALARNLDADYPVVVAQCQGAGAPAPSLRSADVKLPDPEATPLFEVAKTSR